MPTYEYQCTECGHGFEEFQPISAAPITTCPKCKGKTERVISGGTGFVFKGSGFYITENRSKDYKSKEASESTSPSVTTSSDKKPNSDSK